jgi:carbon-monoxide dehydrogenase medium subunit
MGHGCLCRCQANSLFVAERRGAPLPPHDGYSSNSCLWGAIRRQTSRCVLMKPPRFCYFTPQNVEEALTLLTEHVGEGQVLAGGQSLVPLMNMRLIHPSMLIDINGIAELAYIRSCECGFALGAMTRYVTIARDTAIKARLPLLVDATRSIGYPSTRNRGTLGGCIAYAHPCAEIPAVMLALNAEFEACRRDSSSCWSSRIISAKDFFKGNHVTDLKEDELLTEIRIPALPARVGSAFLEFSQRQQAYPLAGVATVVVLDKDGMIADARLGLCSVGPAPVRPQAAEALLRGRCPVDETWNIAANVVVTALDHPPSDIHGSADYRRHLAAVLVRQALALAAERAERN